MDPASTVRFRYRRSAEGARAGEPLLSALARRGWPSLSRSVRYHRPRGPFCGVGDCTGCLVRVNGVPNVRACRHPLAEGDRVQPENSWPSPRFDLLGVLDALLPKGVDTVHGLRRPAWAAALYQRVGRRLAGFGRPPDRSAARPVEPPRTIEREVAIVGAGRSGRAVAEALLRRGTRPVLLERLLATGAPGAVGEGASELDVLHGVTAAVLPPSPVAGPPGSDGRRALLGFDRSGRGVVVRARTVVLATGGYDGGLLFEGSDRPGVVTGDLALSGLGLPLGEAVVFGGGGRARQVVERLGQGVRAVVALGEIDPDLTRAAVDLGVPLYPRSRLVRALGRGHVSALELARRDGGGTFRLPCRSVVLAHRRLPNAQLAFQAGAGRRWYGAPGTYFPEVDAAGGTGVPGIYVVGSAARPPQVVAPGPEEVTSAILGDAPPAAVPAPAPPSPGEMVPYYRELLREPRHGKWVICPCEDVLLDELEKATARGYRGLEVVMRYTGVGTGLCQGRYCLPEALSVLAVLEDRLPPEVGHVTQRPPLVPTPLGALAGLSGEFVPEAPS